MRQPRTIKIVFAGKENLRLRLQLAKGMRVDDPVAVDLECVAVVGLPRGAEGFAVEGLIETIGHREIVSTRTAPCARCNLAMPHATFATPLGTCAIAWNERGLTRFLLPDPARPSSGGTERDPPPWVVDVIARVQRHIAGEPQDFSDVSYDFGRMPEFQRAVLRATLAVKSGHTATY